MLVKQLRIWLGLVVSLACVWFAIQGIDFGIVLNSLGRLNWFWLFIYFIPYVGVFVLKVIRWQVIFHPVIIGFRRLFSALMISFLWNTILPARLGEVVRAFVVNRSEKVGIAKVFSTIFLEKILDIITLLLFLVVLLPFLAVQDSIKQPAMILGGGVIFAFLICLLMAARRREAEKFVRFLTRKLPAKIETRIQNLISEILDTLTVLLKLDMSLKLWFQSIVMWGLNSSLCLLVAWSLNMNLSVGQAILVMVASNLGMAVPSSPGYIGTYELVIKLTLLPFFPGQESLLLTYAVLLHILSFIPVAIPGAYYSWKEGLEFGKFDKKKIAVKEDENNTVSLGNIHS